ncbi:hypothetical protein [Adhaeribacter soli]|uniref:Uncharacterized protein n=1 Tax=Adhaeribacter soli TaxID=2607655 RepID=A0A5N1J1J6_9BACT|nr:hypothetical protein [Adhaeribacter soli]KAA9340278.1 hypothetical protein F0P94_07995 [Adhaeribacter soli]
MKKLLFAALLFLNVLAARAGEPTLDQQAANFARQAAGRLELNEDQIIAVRKLKLAALQAMQENNPAVSRIQLEEELNQKVAELLNRRQKALLNNQANLLEFIATGN